MKNQQGTTSSKYWIRDHGKNFSPFPDIESVKEWLNEIRKMRKYSKTLHLSLKKEWYNMIESGVKKEEYREIKPYYISRFPTCFTSFEVLFKNGYSKNAPSFRAKCLLSVGYGKPEWGAEPNKRYFILTILEIN